MSMKKIIYDDGDDSLTFIKNSAGDHTVNTGFTLITFDKKGNVTALELMGAYKNFKIPKDVLMSIESAKITFNLNHQKKKILIKILIQYADNEKPVSIIEDFSNIDLLIQDQKLSVSIA